MKDIVCMSGVELLMEYLEGALAPDVRAAIEAHVAGCPRCDAFIASYLETPRIVRDATRMEMPADLEASLLAALRRAMHRTMDRVTDEYTVIEKADARSCERFNLHCDFGAARCLSCDAARRLGSPEPRLLRSAGLRALHGPVEPRPGSPLRPVCRRARRRHRARRRVGYRRAHGGRREKWRRRAASSASIRRRRPWPSPSRSTVNRPVDANSSVVAFRPMSTALSVILLIVIVLAAGLLRDSFRTKAVTRWGKTHGFSFVPKPEHDNERLIAWAKRFGTTSASHWGIVLRGETAGLETTIGEHEESVHQEPGPLAHLGGHARAGSENGCRAIHPGWVAGDSRRHGRGDCARSRRARSAGHRSDGATRLHPCRPRKMGRRSGE